MLTSLEFEFSDGLQGLRSVRKRRFVRDKLPESEILRTSTQTRSDPERRE